MSGTEFKTLASCQMDNTFNVVCSALLISVVVWWINPFGKLYNLLILLFKSLYGAETTNRADGVRCFEEMPGPEGLPYFGDVINYLKTSSSEFKEQMAALKSNFEKYGPVFKRTVMGKTIVCIKDPKDVETVFKADGKYPRRPDEIFKPVKLYFKSRKKPTFIGSL